MTRDVTINGEVFSLDSDRIERELAGVHPEPLHDHFVVVNGRRYPPKQVIGLATGLDRADFTTHQARRTLMRLGFSASRRSRPTAEADPIEPGDGGVEALRPFVGQWVAVRDDEVLVAAPTPGNVVAWLARHGQTADSMFRVPASESDVRGAAPA